MKATNGTMFMVILSMLLLGGLAACSQPKEPIKIGISAWAGVEPAELAARKGFYERRGVAVEMVRFSAYTDSIEAFRKGRVDADMQTFDDAIRLFAAGRQMKVVLFTDYSHGGDGIVAKTGIDSVADLRGKTVGVETGTVGHFSLLKAMDTVGLKEEDITIVSIPAWEIKQAFVAEKIDAGVTWEPYLSSTAKEGGGQVIITSRDYPKTIVTTMVVSDDLIAKRRDDVQKIVSAYFEAVRFIKEHPQEAYATMAKAEEISAEEFAHHAEGLQYIDLAGNKAAFGTAQDGELYPIGRDLAAFLYKKRVIKTQPDTNGLLDGSFVQKLR
ncbi:MAG: ABC transporter substrate-binding protein [Desulfobacteria bacterium]